MLFDHIGYLREKAMQLRLAAVNYPANLARRLTDLAAEFEAKAAEIEARRPGKCIGN